MPAESTDPILHCLQQGRISLRGEFMWGSNYTYLVEFEDQETSLQAVYKPTRGVRPLWDFPSATLARREVAAYLLSKQLGWDLVPLTTYRKNGPFGPGSIQLYIEHDPEYHYFNFSDEDRQRLRPTVLFDLVINNADRKGSHILMGADRHIWLIDHGICFHVENKLRTVVWDFAGEPIPSELCSDLGNMLAQLQPNDGEPSELAKSLAPMLSHSELKALAKRAQELVDSGRFPSPDPNRRPYPWPPV